MRKIGVAVLVFLTLLLAAFVVVVQTLPPPPLPAPSPAAAFSAERAIEHVHVIARQPHPTGSQANEKVRDYILAKLQELGLETRTQRDGELENVLARIVGTSSADAVLLTAHYDSTLQSPGASDDSSGVAALLETARALMSAAPMRNTVMFLFTDHEEGGMYGARAFIADHPWVKDVKVVIGFDAGGISGPAVLSAVSPDNGWLIRQLVQADPYIVGSSAINALADSSTDFGHAFKAAGFSGYAFDYYWDKRDGPEDNLENLNPASLQHQGYHALSLARHFGNLNWLDDPREPDAVYFSFLRLFVVSYSPTLAILMSSAVLGVFAAVLGFGLRRRILSWVGIGYGVLVMVAGLMIAPIPSVILDVLVGTWIPGVTSDYDNRLLDQPLQMSLIVLTSLALIMLWYSQSRRIRNTSLPDLTMGALLPTTLAMPGVSVLFPALSFGFTWPLLFSLLAIVNWFYWSARQERSRIIILGLLISGAISVVIVGPSVLLGLFDQLSLSLVFLGALSGFLTPQIHLMFSTPIWSPGPMQETGVKSSRLPPV